MSNSAGGCRSAPCAWAWAITLRERALFRCARRTLRDALWLVSGAFPDRDFPLVSNTSAYSADSTAQVLAAATDPDGNPYRWASGQLLDRELVLDPSVGPAGTGLTGGVGAGRPTGRGRRRSPHQSSRRTPHSRKERREPVAGVGT
ncbi:hypothetical protein ACWDE9_21125, partial [Streptomyces olivaceoviridis]